MNKTAKNAAHVFKAALISIFIAMFPAFASQEIIFKSNETKTNDSSPDSIKRIDKDLIDAVRSELVESANMCLKKDADVDCRDENGRTPLILAAISGNYAIVKMLVERGASLDETDRRHFTALAHACVNEKIPVIKYLIGKGADVNTGFENKNLAMSYALEKNLSEVSRLLREAGATETIELRGFRDIVFGTPIENIRGMKIIQKYEDYDVCSRNSDKMKIGPHFLSEISYYAVSEKIEGVFISLNTKDTREVNCFCDLMCEKYGDPVSRDGRKISWNYCNGIKVSATIETSTISFTIMSDRLRKAMYKKSMADF